MNWTQINRLRQGAIRYGDRTFNRMFSLIRKRMRDYLDRVELTGEIERITDVIDFEDLIEEAYINLYVQTGVTFARATVNNMKGRDLLIELKEEETEWRKMMRNFVLKRCGDKIQKVTKTMYANIQKNVDKAILLGTENGWGVEKIANELIKIQGRMDKWKAMQIVRTEAVGASNEGVVLGSNSLDIETEKIWLPAPMTRDFRPDHQEMGSHEPVQKGGFFTLPSGAQMEFPGDPGGPAEEVINCRCAVALQPKEDIISQILES